MNSLNERLKRLEAITNESTLKEKSRRKQPQQQPQVQFVDESDSSDGPSEPLQQHAVSEPIAIPVRKGKDLERELSVRIKEEKKAHRGAELAKLQEHFEEGLVKIHSVFEKVSYTVDYVELNCVRIASLMSTVCSSEFKRTIAISLLDNILDDWLLSDAIAVLVKIKFPKSCPVEVEERFVVDNDKKIRVGTPKKSRKLFSSKKKEEA